MLDTFGLVRNELKRVERLICEEVADFSSGNNIGLPKSAFSAKTFTGKMLRPGLVLLAGKSCGKISNKHILSAGIFELIHNATLFHDDVLDEGKKRRGVSTVNVLCGNEYAILLGDFLLSRAFQICSELPADINRRISLAAAQTCMGELQQSACRYNWRLTESGYINIISQKSAALFSSSCYIGAVLAGADKKKANALADFGLNFGIAFQIADDIADLIGNENKSGKTLGRDVYKGYLTLPLIRLLKQAGSQRKSIQNKIANNGHNIKFIQSLAKEFNALEYSYNQANHYADKAIKSLSVLPSSKAKDALIKTAELIIN